MQFRIGFRLGKSSNCVYVNTFMGYFMDYHSTIAGSSTDNSKNKNVKTRKFWRQKTKIE